MKTKQTKTKGKYPHILNYTARLIREGFDTAAKVTDQIIAQDLMSTASKTGSSREGILKAVTKCWGKAIAETEAGDSSAKKMADHEKLRLAVDLVHERVTFDTFTQKYILEDDSTTNPVKEYITYNQQADYLTFIEKHFFVSAFEAGGLPERNILKEWGENLPVWNKRNHIAQLLSYVPAKDPTQAELFLTGWLIRAYIQAVNPSGMDTLSIVNRWFLILHQNRQDTGKTGLLKWLSPNKDWVKTSGLEENKDGYTALAKYMFVLDDELTGLGSFKYQEKIKSMVSCDKVDVRPPYGAADLQLARVASFYGSTNNDKIFSATDGNSRFLVIMLDDQEIQWEQYVKKIDKNQLWSQIKTLASTDWLKKNEKRIITYRQEINSELVKDLDEMYACETYFEAATDSDSVMPAGEVAEILRDVFGYAKINLNYLGHALRKLYGPRINGFTSSGSRRMGYPVQQNKNAVGNKSGKKATIKSTIFPKTSEN